MNTDRWMKEAQELATRNPGWRHWSEVDKSLAGYFNGEMVRSAPGAVFDGSHFEFWQPGDFTGASFVACLLWSMGGASSLRNTNLFGAELGHQLKAAHWAGFDFSEADLRESVLFHCEFAVTPETRASATAINPDFEFPPPAVFEGVALAGAAYDHATVWPPGHEPSGTYYAQGEACPHSSWCPPALDPWYFHNMPEGHWHHS